ncbi:HD domain-containing phosphohydrolase [Actinoplanes sp. CA-142083]|uniref:HD domain-containing phosphohydrolase n=1 Tax=Actinoplanes sp. CA-142083 TaxID=3239903 RepID=UPI003D8DAFDD
MSRSTPPHEPGEVRLLEVLAALSLATDLGMGQPLGHALRCALIAGGIADELSRPAADRAATCYTALVRYVGCTSDAAEVARFAGDEIALAAAVAPWVMGDAEQEERAAGVPGTPAAKAAAMAAHCEAAGLLVARLPLGPEMVAAVRGGFARWDGAGYPPGLAGEEIPLPARIAIVARDVELWSRTGGPAAAVEVARERRGRAYDPRVVDAFCAAAPPLLARAGAAGWDELLAAEPFPLRVAPAHLGELLEVLADFADAKVPAELGRSRLVSRLAGRAGGYLGLDGPTAAHAGLVADLGRAGVSTAVWAGQGRLSLPEWEQVRLHPYLSERILSRSPGLRPLAAPAGAHHERLDGSGYYRGVGAGELTLTQQVVATADAYATGTLLAEARAGRFDRQCADAVLAAAGEPVPPPPRWPAGLTDREVDVLRLACRGQTKQGVADRLGISAKTVNRHLESSYAKMGVSTRAAAALFAMQHGLLG